MDITNLIGKFALIYTQGVEAQYAAVITVDRVEEISGRTFLVGMQPTELCGRENWLGGKECYVAWDSVAQMHIFDDYESFESGSSSDGNSGFFGLFKS